MSNRDRIQSFHRWFASTILRDRLVPSTGMKLTRSLCETRNYNDNRQDRYRLTRIKLIIGEKVREDSGKDGKPRVANSP